MKKFFFLFLFALCSFAFLPQGHSFKSLDPAVRIESSGVHSCLISNGSAKCWGGNYYGETGDINAGNSVSFDKPVRHYGVQDVSLGLRFSCFLYMGAVFKCFGKPPNDVAKIYSKIKDKKNTATVVAMLSGKNFLCLRFSDNETICSHPFSDLISHSNSDFFARGDILCAVRSTRLECWSYADTYKSLDVSVQFKDLIAMSEKEICGLHEEANSFSMRCYSFLSGKTTNTPRRKIKALDIQLKCGKEHCCLLLGDYLDCLGDNRLGQSHMGLLKKKSNNARLVALPFSTCLSTQESMECLGLPF